MEHKIKAVSVVMPMNQASWKASPTLSLRLVKTLHMELAMPKRLISMIQTLPRDELKERGKQPCHSRHLSRDKDQKP